MTFDERHRDALGGGHEDGSDVSAQQDRARRGGEEPEGGDAILVGVGAVDVVLASAKVAGAQEGWQMPEEPVCVGDDGEGRYDGLLDQTSSSVSKSKHPKDQGCDQKAAAVTPKRKRRS